MASSEDASSVASSKAAGEERRKAKKKQEEQVLYKFFQEIQDIFLSYPVSISRVLRLVTSKA